MKKPKVHVVDGTFELFRAYYGAPPHTGPDGQEIGATRTFLRSLWGLLQEPDVTHVACAFDTRIECFRNDLFDGYKTGEGMDPDLWAQFPLVEEGSRQLGVAVWSMIDFEADDALATAAKRYADKVSQVVICSPDKDLCQCVSGSKVVSFDRIRKKTLDEDGVRDKFGVSPESIPDWLALVGDTADGIPGIPRWGAKSTSSVLAHYRHLEEIPDDPSQWEPTVRGAKTLAANLVDGWDDALLYRTLATLRTDVPLKEKLSDLEWRGARSGLRKFCDSLGDATFCDRVTLWR